MTKFTHMTVLLARCDSSDLDSCAMQFAERDALCLWYTVDCAASKHGLGTVRVTGIAMLFAVRYHSILQWCADAFGMRWWHGDMCAQAVACKPATGEDTVTKHSLYSSDTTFDTV